MSQQCASVHEGEEEEGNRLLALRKVVDQLARVKGETKEYRFTFALGDLLLSRCAADISRQDVLEHLGEPPKIPSSELGRPTAVVSAWNAAVDRTLGEDPLVERPFIFPGREGRNGWWYLKWTQPPEPDGAIAVSYRALPGRSRLSFWLRLLFHKDAYNLQRAADRFAFFGPIIGPFIVIMLIVAAISVLAVANLLFGNASSDMIPSIAAAALIFIWPYLKLHSFFRYRSMLLGDFAADQVVLDLEKSSDGQRMGRFIIISADCPLCGGEVALDKGWREFGRPIVGRCRHSPIEHVFTFDRARMRGAPLRASRD